MDSSKYVSIIEYAREHNISDMTVRRRIKTGKLYAVLKEGKYFIPADGTQQQSPSSEENNFERRIPSSSSSYRPPTREEPVSAPLQARVKDERVSSYLRSPLRYDSPPGKTELEAPVSDERLKKIDRLLNSSSPSRSNLESKKLIELCEKVLAKIEKSEFFLEEKFFGKFDSLESELNILRSRFEASNLRVGRLEKKLEELKMLVDIMESEGLVAS